MPPGSSARSPSSPRTTCSDARRLAAGFGQRQRAVREIERRQVLAAAELRAAADASAAARRSSGAAPARGRLRSRSRCACRRAAARAPCGLPRSPAAVPAVRSRNGLARRTRSSAAAHDARLERLEVGGDVRQLRHLLFPQPAQPRLEVPSFAAIVSQESRRLQRIIHYCRIHVIGQIIDACRACQNGTYPSGSAIPSAELKLK